MDEIAFMRQTATAHYPTAAEVDAWAEGLLRRSEQIQVSGELLDTNPVTVPFGNSPNTLANRYVKFTADDARMPFYGYWQPSIKAPAPLLINLPGYGSSITMHPQIADMGYHVLHISPLDYAEPGAVRMDHALPDGRWPVLDHTARGLSGGYEDWLSDCLLAIRWALARPEVLPDRLSFFGTSQGGGGALLLASILGERVRCVCADLPFLTDFPGSGLNGPAYDILRPAYEEVERGQFWRRLGFVDTVSHAHRLHIPVMLSSGGQDLTCPSATVEHLFDSLHCTKQYTFLEHGVHTHSRESMALFGAWLHLFA